MEKLEVNKITLSEDGVLKVETNISDNLELAKHVNKDKMEMCLNNHPLELHIYQMDQMISSIRYKGECLSFGISDFYEFMEYKRNKQDE